MNRLSRILLVAAAMLGLTGTVFAQYTPGAQPVVLPTFQPAAQNFTATAQTGAVLNSTALKSGIIQVVGQPVTAAVAAPVITGTTTSIATYTLNAAGDTFSGTINVNVATLGNCTFTVPAYSTLAAAVTAFNANTNCYTTMGLTASNSSATFVLTQGGTSKTITDNGSALVDNKAWTTTWAMQGSIDNVNWYPLPTAALPTTSVPITTTALTQTTAVTTQTATLGTAYVVGLSGFNHFRFVTSSTFTSGAKIAISLSAVPHASIGSL